MGEQNQRDNTNSNNPTPPQENQELEIPNDEQEQEEQLTEVEYQQLDSQLDALFTALDDIESKNDNIHAQLLQLLDANREVRKQLSVVEKGLATSDEAASDKSDTNENN